MRHIRGVVIVSAGLAIGAPVYAGTISFSEIPLYLTSRADPNVLFNMSVEWPTSGNAYNDHIDTGSGGLCPGRPANESGAAIGQCYFATTKYIGYFDSSKCYVYSSNRFEPSGATNSSYQCSGKWSGNFLNWATMTAIDEFRWALTGGNRITDTTTETVLQRAYIDRTAGSGSFPVKKISSTATTVGSGTIPGVAPSTVTPYSNATIYIRNVQNITTGTSTPTATPTPGFTVGTNATATNLQATPLLARVKVCDPLLGLEPDQCTAYGSNYKPEGLIQKNAQRMRFALTSYLLDNSATRDGGVLRARMKYAGPRIYTPGSGYSANTNLEWSDTTGIFVANPNPADASASGVSNSGVINYLNKFGERGYKGFDQIGELFYESLRYLKHLDPTPEYTAGVASGSASLDQFPAINWKVAPVDPIQHYCQKNFIVGINDANPWLDKKLPGTYFRQSNGVVTMFNGVPHMLSDPSTCSSATPITCSSATAPAGTTNQFCKSTASGPPCYVALHSGDYNEPSNADPAINVQTLTNTVGSLEGLGGTTIWTNTGNWTSVGSSGTASGVNDSLVGGPGTYDGSCTTSKSGINLGEVMTTCSNVNKQNTYYISGLAYYANTQDIRLDLAGPDPEDVKQTVSTFMIDTQEFSANPLDGPKNMLWLTGKYGGFIDSNNNDQPDLATEWDEDGDGLPDNYVLANSPEKMVTALVNAFNKIDDATSSASSVAANSTTLNTGSHIYQARFATGDWSGQLLSYSISTSGVISPTADWDTGQLINSQSPSSRVILTYNDAPLLGSPDGVAFQWLNLNLAQQTALNTHASGTVDVQGLARLNYLRGDTTNESSGAASLKFRKRLTSKLGDIINSNPAYVGPPNAGYPDASYAAFRTNNSSRQPIVYVGANDGMLHAIDATCTPSATACTPTATSGKEVLAYVPRPVYKNLSRLTAPNYNGLPNAHRYFVDGTPTVADVQIGGVWKTIVVGGLGAGGQGIYALDATDPATFSESNAASLVLWEFTDSHDNDLGYTFSQPQVAKMANGKWAVIVGNGYNNSEADGSISATGHGVLYILFIQEGTDGGWTLGTDYVKIDTQVGSTGTPNGLATPFVADTNGDGIADYVYVGDLLGNMWKFDVTNATPSNWQTSFGSVAAPAPLFAATDSASTAQPITSSVEVTRHPNGGFMVLFGTGQYLSIDDVTSPYNTQSFYGIWDKNDGTTVTRSQLQQQTVLGTATGGDGLPYRVTSDNSVNYTTQRGWYMDLPTSGERDVFNPVLRFGRIIFTTAIPLNTACDGGGESWLMEVDAISGRRLTVSPFSTNGDSVFDTYDAVTFGAGTYFVSGRKSTVGVINQPTVIGGDPTTVEGKKKEYKVTSGSSGNTESIVENAAGVSGRLNWREIIKD